MVTPTGLLKKYTPNTYVKNQEIGEVISDEMPQDKNYIRDTFSNTLLFNLLKQQYPNVSNEDIINARYENYDSILNLVNKVKSMQNQ